MKDKNAFILSSEFRAFIIVMTFVAVSAYRQLIELLFRDLIRLRLDNAFLGVAIYKKNSMDGVWIREN